MNEFSAVAFDQLPLFVRLPRLLVGNATDLLVVIEVGRDEPHFPLEVGPTHTWLNATDRRLVEDLPDPFELFDLILRHPPVDHDDRCQGWVSRPTQPRRATP